MKRSTVILTLLFNEYSRQRFSPSFKNTAAQVLLDLDREDKQCGSLEEIHQQLRSAYCQLTVNSHEFCKSGYTMPINRNSCQVIRSSTSGTKKAVLP